MRQLVEYPHLGERKPAVEQPGLEALLRDAGGAHGDVHVARDPFRLLHGAFDVVGDERERRSLVVPLPRDRARKDEDRHVYLTEEFHYAVGRTTIEAVSGGVEPGEDALATARRELQEEIGIEAEEWTDLGTVDPFTASIVSPTRLYLARKLRFGEQSPEGTEQIRCVGMPLDEAVRMVLESEITHGPSCVLILKAARMVEREP
jgi:8-oxo-dGTP pyrophosphatase MutT (NUDIX family)